MELGQIPEKVMRGVIDDTHLEDIRIRNKERSQRIIKSMADRWCCHPQYKSRTRRNDVK